MRALQLNQSSFYDACLAPPAPAPVPLCSHLCSTCSGDPFACTDCNGGAHRRAAPDCSCQPGFYDRDALTSCAACQFNCAECRSLADNCLSCASPLFDANNHCLCHPGYYASTTTCLPCESLCTTCSALHNCTTCVLHAQPDANGDCVCDYGYFDNGLGACDPCAPHCVTCVAHADNCTLC